MTGLEAFFVLMVGLCFGSFVTLASYRLPRDEDIFVTPSRCPACRTALTACDLVPVFSWLAQGGRCRHCAAPVHWRYPVIELVTATVFLLIAQRAGLTWEAALLALLGVGLLVMIVVDLEHMLIPDEVHLLLLPAGLAYRFLSGAAWGEVLGGLALGLGIGLILRFGYRWVRHKEGLGLGDVKFLAMAGLWLGVLPLVPYLFLSGVLGVATALIWRALGRGKVFPFGPALALALFLCVLYPEVPDTFWNIHYWLYQ